MSVLLFNRSRFGNEITGMSGTEKSREILPNFLNDVTIEMSLKSDLLFDRQGRKRELINSISTAPAYESI